MISYLNIISRVEIKLDDIEKAVKELKRSLKPELDMANKLIGGLYDKLEDIKGGINGKSNSRSSVINSSIIIINCSNSVRMYKGG